MKKKKKNLVSFFCYLIKFSCKAYFFYVVKKLRLQKLIKEGEENKSKGGWMNNNLIFIHLPIVHNIYFALILEGGVHEKYLTSIRSSYRLPSTEYIPFHSTAKKGFVSGR